MDRAIHYEYHTDEAERADKYYQNLFGSSLQKWMRQEEYWMVKTGTCDNKYEQPNTFRSIEVKSLKKVAEKIQQCGGQLIVPRVEIPDVGVLAYCLDAEGNLLGILERTSP